MLKASVKCELVIEVIHAYPVKRGKARIETVAIIKFGPIVLGSRKLVGNWSNVQVLNELKKNGTDSCTLTEQGRELLPKLLC